MHPSRHYFLIAPALLALACSGGGNTTAGASASDGSSSSSSSSSTSEPGDPTTTSTTTNPTTSGTDSGTSTSTGEPGTSTTTGDDSVTDSTSSTGTPPAQTCDGTEDCDGGFCWATYDGQMGEFLCSRECVADAGTDKAETQWCADSAACCSGEATCDNVGYCQLGGDTTSDTDTSTGTGTDTDTGTGTETDTDTSSSSSSGTDTGGGELKIEISGLMVIANCMPAVPPDPVNANWTLVVDNTQGAMEVTADVAVATLTYSPGNMEFVQKIEVDPITSGPVAAGDSNMTMMSKTQALDDLPMDCEQCDKPVVLALTLDVGGQEVPVSAEATLECVF